MRYEGPVVDELQLRLSQARLHSAAGSPAQPVGDRQPLTVDVDHLRANLERSAEIAAFTPQNAPLKQKYSKADAAVPATGAERDTAGGT
jgi:hypothetical protein